MNKKPVSNFIPIPFILFKTAKSLKVYASAFRDAYIIYSLVSSYTYLENLKRDSANGSVKEEQSICWIGRHIPKPYHLCFGGILFSLAILNIYI